MLFTRFSLKLLFALPIREINLTRVNMGALTKSPQAKDPNTHKRQFVEINSPNFIIEATNDVWFIYPKFSV